MQAIEASSCHTTSLEKATAIYVYDYCYYIWWVASTHSLGWKEKGPTPGDYLMKVAALQPDGAQ